MQENWAFSKRMLLSFLGLWREIHEQDSDIVFRVRSFQVAACAEMGCLTSHFTNTFPGTSKNRSKIKLQISKKQFCLYCSRLDSARASNAGILHTVMLFYSTLSHFLLGRLFFDTLSVVKRNALWSPTLIFNGSQRESCMLLCSAALLLYIRECGT